MSRHVHQLLAALSYGDAIGNEALAIQKHLRAAGFASDIFAEKVHPRDGPPRPSALGVRAGVVAGDGLPLPLLDRKRLGAPHLPRPGPPRVHLPQHHACPLLPGLPPHLAGLCHHGRRELEAFAPRTELGLGDSEFNRRELEEAGFARTAVLPIVLDLAKYDRPRSRVVDELYSDARTNLLFVGRIIPNKKIEDLIRVFAVYQRYVNPVSRLLLVGDYRGHERYFQRLLEMVDYLRLDEVVFTGQVDDDELISCYRVADLFLCLSEHEGFCVPLQEAMVFGVPGRGLRHGRGAGDAARRRSPAAGEATGGGGGARAPRAHRRGTEEERAGHAGTRRPGVAGDGFRSGAAGRLGPVLARRRR